MSCRPFPFIRPTLLLSAIAVLLSSSPNTQAEDYWDPGYDSGGGRGGGLFGDSDFSYGYFDFGYFQHEFERAGIDNADGFAGEISIPLIDSLFVKAALGYASPEDIMGDDLDYLAWELGAGLGIPLTRSLDIVIEGGLAHQKLEGGLIDRLDEAIDGYGYYVSPTVRLALGDLIELNGGVIFRNIDSDSDIAVDLKALLHLTSGISIWGGAIFSEEVNQYGVGLRLSF